MERLEGRTVAITGGASGIGLAMAGRFGRAGMRVALADIEAEPLEAARRTLEQEGIEVATTECDVADAEQVTAFSDFVIDRFGSVHVVCNNAGVGPPGGILEMGLDDWDWILGVNLYGVLHGIRAFLPHLIAQGEGHVVNTASVAGLLPQPGMAAYNVSKHGVVVLSEALHYELQMLGSPVGVSVVCPAWIRTRIFESERNRPGGPALAAGPVTDRIRAAADRLAQSSHRSPEEVADQVLAAVRNDQFYVITHPGILKFVKQRHADIEQMRNPSVDQGI